MTARPPSTIVCDVGEFNPDVACVGALARLSLGARRLGVEVRLRGASSELHELLAFCGLDGVLPVETLGQAEEREEPLRVEEEAELDDPAL
jgi:hypothetical protein